MLKSLEKMPVPLLPTMVGAITLANYMQGFGFEWVRHATVWASIIIWLCYLGKIVLFPKTCKGEYDKTVLRSLYAGFTMIMMGVSDIFFLMPRHLQKVYGLQLLQFMRATFYISLTEVC